MSGEIVISVTEQIAAIVAAIAVVVIAVLFYTLHKREKAMWKQVAEDNYNRGKGDGAEEAKVFYDQIEEERERLEALTEKELLVQTMLALGSYARRMDRVDTKLKCITNYKAYIDDMNSCTQKLSQGYTVLEGHISTTAAIVGDLRKDIQETGKKIGKLVDDLGSLKDLHTKIEGHMAALSNAERTLGALRIKISGVVEDMNSVMETHDQAPMKKLKGIEKEVTDLIKLVSSLIDQTRMVSNEVSSINNKVDQATDEYTTYSLCYRIAAIANNIDSLDNEIGSVNSKVGDIRSAIEESFSHYGYNSIYSKLDDIESSVSSIRDRVNA